MSVILEANQNNADKVFANGKYNCSFPTGITFNKGDRLTARLCSIDSQKSDANTIIINEDITATITYSYYDCDYDSTLAPLKTTLASPPGPWNGPTYKYYSAYTAIQLYSLASVHVNVSEQPPLEMFTFVIIFARFRYIDADGVAQRTDALDYATTLGNNGSGSPSYDVDLPSSGGMNIVYQRGTLELVDIVFDLNASDQITCSPLDYRPAQNIAYPQGDPIAGLRLGTSSVNIAAGRYDPSEISELLTQGYSNPLGIQTTANSQVQTNQILTPNNRVLINLQEISQPGMFFSEIRNIPPDLSLTSITTYQWPQTPPYYFLGANLMAFQYGVTGSIFQWSFGHMPFFNPGANQGGIRNAVIYATGAPVQRNVRYYLLNTASGIVIHDLQPTSFWSSIGLYNEDQQPIITPLITDPVSGLQYFTANSWQSPREGSSVNFFTPLFNRTPVAPVPGTPTYLSTDAIDTAALLGDVLTSNIDGGYFLIRAAFNGSTSEYYDKTDIYDNIVSIVSTQYNSANTITGFSDSAVVYEHLGAPYIISSVAIDILDPLTKQTAAQLGKNNTIIFQIDRAPQDISILDDKGKTQVVQVLS